MAAQVEGVRETLRELGKVDKSLRRAVGKQIRSAAAPLQAGARSKLPDSPLSNWTTGRYAYDAGAARSGVIIKLGGGRGPSGGGGVIGSASVIPLVTMQQKNAGGAVYDMAGRRSSGKSPQGRAFIAGLNRSGQASRSMWPAAEEQRPAVEKAVVAAIRDMERVTNERLRR